jgi:hypothetical protein
MKRAEWDSIDASLCFLFLRGFWFRVLDVLKRDDDDDDPAVVYTRRRRTVLTAMPIVAWGFVFQSLSRGTLNTSRADRCSQLVGHERFVSFPSARWLKKNADESLGASPRFYVHTPCLFLLSMLQMWYPREGKRERIVPFWVTCF